MGFRIVSLLLPMLLAGCPQMGPSYVRPDPPSDDYARLVIYRETGLGGAAWSHTFSIDGTEVASLRVSGYTTLLVRPGVHEVHTGLFGQEGLRIRFTFHGGQTYYVKESRTLTHMSPGYGQALDRLGVVPLYLAEREIADYRFNEPLLAVFDGPGLPQLPRGSAGRTDMMARSPSGSSAVAEPTAYPYATFLDIKFPALTRVDVPGLVKACTDRWYNQTLCKVNDSVVRLGVMQGEYHWHKHDNDDEFFFVLDGHFLIDLEERTIDLQRQEGFVVPRGVVHRTRAPDRAVILMVETAAIVPTGDPAPAR